ncbi:NAD(P)-dependent oxidoreductase [Amycolatopsis jejuensis]|uniref:NAD(P)-dependent oxidoreductase n=1 Tax=Amycolatopsis jejuensis TaxID=330084 RepID=UPI000525985E|nr:NAD(P)-dependent oxidoreductase [Amycolatopsis jejuensis]
MERNEVQKSVGLLGAGSIGEHYLANLVKHYGDVAVFDTDAGRVEAASVAGGRVVESAKILAAECDVVLVSLPNPPAVRAAFKGGDGLLAGLRPGALVVDTSTVSPEVNREMSALVQGLGGGYLDAPVSGGQPAEAGVEGAKAATMTFMVGGGRSDFDRAQELFDVLGSHAMLLGPSGSGTVVKLISNLCSGIHLLIAAEAFALGAACGFSTEELSKVFRQTDAKSYIMTDYLIPRILAHNTVPGFTVDLQVKDHRLAQELAHDVKVPLPFNALAIQTWERLRAQNRGQHDIADSSFFIAEQAGQSLHK